MLSNLLVILMIVSGYIVVYYRLMVRFHYEKATGIKETTFGTLFSLPSRKGLGEKGKKYVSRYWIALIILMTCVISLAKMRGTFEHLMFF